MARELLIHKCHPRLTPVGKVLTGNGITRYGNGAYSLIGGDQLLELCRQRLVTDSVLSGVRRWLVRCDRRISSQSSASTTLSNFSAKTGMLSETICQMVSSSRPK